MGQSILSGPEPTQGIKSTLALGFEEGKFGTVLAFKCYDAAHSLNDQNLWRHWLELGECANSTTVSFSNGDFHRSAEIQNDTDDLSTVAPRGTDDPESQSLHLTKQWPIH